MKIDESKPLENLVGDNRGIVRMRLANLHCMTPVLEQARAVRPKRMRDVPVALRRGWAKCVLETVAEYRKTYVEVMTRSPYDQTKITAFD